MDKISQLNKDLIDPVSYELFDAQANKPITLPCGHNISEQTLRITYNYKIASCPLCRKEVPSNFEFSPNITLINFLRVYHAQVKTTASCSQHTDQTVQGICMTCMKFLCFTCLLEDEHAGHDKGSLDKYLQTMDQKVASVEESLNNCHGKLKTEHEYIHQQLKPVFKELECLLYETACEDVIKWQNEAVSYVTKLKEITQKKRAVEIIEDETQNIITTQGEIRRQETEKMVARYISNLRNVPLKETLEISNEKKLIKSANASPDKGTSSSVMIEPVKTKAFIEWLRAGDAKFDKLDVVWLDKESRHIHANTDIAKDEQILMIPKSMLMTLQMAYNTGLSKAIKRSGIELFSPKHTHLAALMLEEKYNPDSFWKPYLDMLPPDCGTFPVNFTEEELKELTGSTILDLVATRKEQLRSDYDKVCNVVPEFKKFSYEDFVWGRLNASSRIYGMEINREKTDALVPFADIMNHSKFKKTSWYYDEQLSAFMVTAKEGIPSREQVTNSFGRKCNSRFLMGYGFIVPNNQDYNTVKLKISSDVLVKIVDRKTVFEKQNEATTTEYTLYLNCEADENSQLLSFLRYTLLKRQEDIDIYSQMTVQRPAFAYKPSPISWELEKDVMETLQNMIKERLSKYPTTIEEDRVLLDQNLSHNVRNCVLLRLGEKEVWQENLKFTEMVLKYIEEGCVANVFVGSYAKYGYHLSGLRNEIKSHNKDQAEEENEEEDEDEEGEDEEEEEEEEEEEQAEEQEAQEGEVEQQEQQQEPQIQPEEQHQQQQGEEQSGIIVEQYEPQPQEQEQHHQEQQSVVGVEQQEAQQQEQEQHQQEGQSIVVVEQQEQGQQEHQEEQPVIVEQATYELITKVGMTLY